MKDEPWGRRFFDAAAELLYPPETQCLACRSNLGEESLDGVLCRGCRESLAQMQEAFREEETRAGGLCQWPEGPAYVHCAYPYRDAARELVHRLKFGRNRRAAQPLVSAMSVLPAEDEELIVPVPTTKRRLRQRGFNQAEVLARGLARFYGMPMNARALCRMQDRGTQEGLDRDRRLSNLQGTFRASFAVRGRRVLLIDDVYTTGATAREAVRALREAGCTRVGMLCACRAGLIFDPME